MEKVGEERKRRIDACGAVFLWQAPHLQGDLDQRSWYRLRQDNAAQCVVHKGFEVPLSWASYARGWPQVDFNGGFFWQLIAPLHLDWPIDGADDGVPVVCVCR